MVHLTHGDAAAAVARAAGAIDVMVIRDLLTVGPCDRDPLRHRALRAAQWKIPFEATDELAALPSEAELVLWASHGWSDLVWLWWTLDALSRRGVEVARVRLVRPTLAKPYASAGGATPDEARAALAAAAPVPRTLRDEAIDLWRRYADRSPLALDEARRRGSKAMPELATAGPLHGAWFPRLVDGALRLSELDEQLLAARRDGRPPPERALHPFGDRFLDERLAAWERGGLAIERLLDEGLRTVAEAPPLFVGGCRVNDPAAPWVRVAAGGDYRLTRADGAIS